MSQQQPAPQIMGRPLSTTSQGHRYVVLRLEDCQVLLGDGFQVLEVDALGQRSLASIKKTGSTSAGFRITMILSVPATTDKAHALDPYTKLVDQLGLTGKVVVRLVRADDEAKQAGQQRIGVDGQPSCLLQITKALASISMRRLALQKQHMVLHIIEALRVCAAPLMKNGTIRGATEYSAFCKEQLRLAAPDLVCVDFDGDGKVFDSIKAAAGAARLVAKCSQCQDRKGAKIKTGDAGCKHIMCSPCLSFAFLQNNGRPFFCPRCATSGDKSPALIDRDFLRLMLPEEAVLLGAQRAFNYFLRFNDLGFRRCSAQGCGTIVKKNIDYCPLCFQRIEKETQPDWKEEDDLDPQRQTMEDNAGP